MVPEKHLDEKSAECRRRLRREALARRAELTEAERSAAEKGLLEAILKHEWYRRAEVLLAYKSYGSELSVDAVLREAYLAGKQVFLPRVEGDGMQFYRTVPGQPLIQGFRGILEPAADEKGRLVYEAQRFRQVLMLMPGAAFDRNRNRLGYGRGFYDRYLQDKESMPTIAVGFLCQLTAEEIPAEKTDVRPKEILCF